jgi:hypothetical protein
MVLFSGDGYDSSSFGGLSDVWRATNVSISLSTGSTTAISTGGATASGTTGTTGDGGSQGSETLWEWRSGSTSPNAPSDHGVLGVFDADNVIGAREGVAMWHVPDTGVTWFFGGYNGAKSAYYHDIFAFDGYSWAWMGGSTGRNGAGTYGAQGVASSSALPGARVRSASCVDPDSRSLWLVWRVIVDFQTSADSSFVPPPLLFQYGGYGYDSIGTAGLLGDAFVFNTTSLWWTFIGGTSTAGVANRGRDGAGCVFDSNGNSLLVFGGLGVSGRYYNQLWRISASGTFQLLSGSDTINNRRGYYGALNTIGSNIGPGSRGFFSMFVDRSARLHIVGGYGYGGTTSPKNKSDDSFSAQRCAVFF